MYENYEINTVIILRCGLKATIIQERSVDGYYLFFVHDPQETHRLSEWNIVTHISDPTWADYGLVA